MPLKHRGFGAYISSDGEEVEHFGAKVEDEKTIVCYIPSEEGKQFAVHWVDQKPPSNLSVEVKMDGRRMGVLSHRKQSEGKNSGFRVTLDSHRPYAFSALEMHDDDTLPSAYSDDLGTIEVRIRRVRDFVKVPFVPKTPAKAGPVHERNGKKGLSHRVSLGERREVKEQTHVLRPLLIDSAPYVIFCFKYRPRDFLQAKGLIPLTPSSARNASTPTSATLSKRNKKRPSLPASECARAGPSTAKRRRISATPVEEDIPMDVDEPDQSAGDFVIPVPTLEVPLILEDVPPHIPEASQDSVSDDEDANEVEVHLSAIQRAESVIDTPSVPGVVDDDPDTEDDSPVSEQPSSASHCPTPQNRDSAEGDAKPIHLLHDNALSDCPRIKTEHLSDAKVKMEPSDWEPSLKSEPEDPEAVFKDEYEAVKAEAALEDVRLFVKEEVNDDWKPEWLKSEQPDTPTNATERDIDDKYSGAEDDTNKSIELGLPAPPVSSHPSEDPLSRRSTNEDSAQLATPLAGIERRISRARPRQTLQIWPVSS